jgi:tRNA threonylcarbamoyladenosine biosynthesis protein TsaE
MTTEILQLEYTLDTIATAARSFITATRDFAIMAFSGEMGAGKTTFIHNVCDILQVEDTVSSPTFSLINEYHFRDAAGKDRTIFHQDWYRLRDTAEAINAGMEDCLMNARRDHNYCFIEWPEKAPELLQKPYLWITIAATGLDSRTMKVELIQ